MTEEDLLAAMRAAPDDANPRLVYADWLLARGDVRGEMITLEHRMKAGASSAEELQRLLELSAEHGFPRLPDDPCARILRFTGGGSYPTQYETTHDGHDYYLRWRHGFSIDVDDVGVLEIDLDTHTTNQWTFRETTVILAIVSEAILTGVPMAELHFPNEEGIRAHPKFHVGRAPLYGFPGDFSKGGTRFLELRDRARWYDVWRRWQRLLGNEPPPERGVSCACGVPGLSCSVEGCA